MSRYAQAHADPQGPNDARPTALQIIEDENLSGKLVGKSVFITGANQGLGLETARALHSAGATVYIGARNRTTGQLAIDDIQASDANDAPLHVVEISLDSFDSVRKAAEDLLAQNDKLNLLILNAGVMFSPKGKTVDGFETQLAINYLGHFLLFQLLKPALLAASTPEFNSRVISLSSTGHRAGGIRFEDLNFDEPDSYDPMLAYGQAKTANIYLANEIERRYGSQGLHALSLHPGIINTNLAKYMTQEMKDFMGNHPVFQKRLKSVAQGAATTVYAAVSKDWEGKGGKYLYDCAEAGPVRPDSDYMSVDDGYAEWIYDQDKASKLWTESIKLVGLEKDA
jgi:NAD(P)-dependent dehydrogenase (short-subunit alcohol dehydrogenase family)